MGIFGQVVRTDKASTNLVVLIGNLSFMSSHDVAMEDTLIEEIKHQEEQGQTVLLVSIEGKAMLYI
jgi:cation transport ATPase